MLYTPLGNFLMREDNCLSLIAKYAAEKVLSFRILFGIKG